MKVIVDIPDEFADLLLPAGEDWPRLLFEGLVAQAYRTERITVPQLQRILNDASWHEVEAFLKRYEIGCYTVADLEMDLKSI